MPHRTAIVNARVFDSVTGLLIEASTIVIEGELVVEVTREPRTFADSQVIDAAGTNFYGQMARLGLAEAQARAGQYEQAIIAFKDLSLRKDGPLPVDGILMQLGRVYVDAGKKTEAQQTFNRVVEEFPESPFSGDARKELDNLKKT